MHLHPVSQHENALELPRGDTAIEVVALFLILLAATDHQLIIRRRDIEIVFGKSGNRNGDAQPLRA